MTNAAAPVDPAASCPECGADRSGGRDRFCGACGARWTTVRRSMLPSATDGTGEPAATAGRHRRLGGAGRAVLAGSAAVILVAGLAGLRTMQPADPGVPGEVEVPDAASDAGSVDDPEEAADDRAAPQPTLACAPQGCERWRIDLEESWTTLGVADDALVLLDRAAVQGGGWGAATEERDVLRLVALEDGEDLLRAPLELTGLDGTPPGAARGLQLLEDAIVIALDGQVVLLGLDGDLRWSHRVEDGVATPLHATEERLLVAFTADTPTDEETTHLQVLDRTDGQLRWEASAGAWQLAGDDVIVLEGEGEPAPAGGDEAGEVTVSGHDVATGEVRWQRGATGIDPVAGAPNAVLLHGAGGDGGDLLVRAADGAETAELDRGARWLGATRDGGGVLVIGDDDPVEVASIDDAGELRWRVTLEGPMAAPQRLLERPERLVLVGRDGSTVVLDADTGETREPAADLPADADDDEWIDDAGRRVERTASGFAITGADDGASITLTHPTTPPHIALHDPYLVWTEHELLAVDPVAAD